MVIINNSEFRPILLDDITIDDLALLYDDDSAQSFEIIWFDLTVPSPKFIGLLSVLIESLSLH